MNLVSPFQLRVSHNSVISRCFPALWQCGTDQAVHHHSHPCHTLSQPLFW